MGYKFNPESGYWEAWYVQRNPKSGKPVVIRRTRLKSENEAKKVEKKLILLVADKIREVTIPRWEAVVDAYIESCRQRGLTEKSLYSMGHCLKAATIEKWGSKTVDQITIDDVNQVIMKDYEHCSNHHKKTLYNFIRNTFTFAMQNNWVARNPTPKLSFRTNSKIKKSLTEEQVKYLLHKGMELEWEWYPHCAMAVYTGMRNGELFALR